MIHIKTITTANGDKVAIRVHFWMSNDMPQYSINLERCPKGKRKFVRIDYDDWDFRALSMDEREIYRNTKYLEIVTSEQLDEAKKELWLKLAPEKAQTNFS